MAKQYFTSKIAVKFCTRNYIVNRLILNSVIFSYHKILSKNKLLHYNLRKSTNVSKYETKAAFMLNQTNLKIVCNMTTYAKTCKACDSLRCLMKAKCSINRMPTEQNHSLDGVYK